MYSVFQTSCLNLDAAILGSFYKDNTSRHIRFLDINRKARGSHHDTGFLAHLGANTCYPCECAELYPFVGVDYIYIHQNRLKEHGADSLDLHVNPTMPASYAQS